MILNLLNNAKDALEECVEKSITINLDLVGDMVQIQIEDTGPGIHDEVMDKIFQPFFTTKDAEKGTGVGLALASQIVDEHNGSINVNSKPGRTVFSILLPMHIT